MTALEPSAGSTPFANRARLRLVAGLAHTINNSLTTTIGCLELALRQVPVGTTLAADLQTALANSDRAARMVRQFVAFATSPVETATVPVSLRDIANSASRLASSCMPGVTVVASGDRPARVAGHEVLILAAVEQVVQNAMEAMPGGGRLTLEADEAGDRCRLWARDNGPGMTSEVRERLFEPFFTTKPFGHLGMGLTLAFELVRAQGGDLTINSSPGLGTTAIFSFPAFRETDARPRSGQRNSPVPAISRAGVNSDVV